MTQTKTAEHAQASLRLLDEAERHLESDDLYKACEKGLEAVNHYLRAVGEQRGWVTETKRDLYDIAMDLSFETDDPKEARLYRRSVEGGFAIEFWGSHHTCWQVEAGIRGARKWISTMESRSKPPPKIRESQLSREREALRRLETRS
ncbi:MAG: hypothetical protein OXC95_15895 [Dehalococcoidia bacterium]|nr:hypothetical protein [Dehalococcoidia bacterium]